MSRINGDKARFNRERKQNIQRRKRSKALFLAAAATAHRRIQARSHAAPPNSARNGLEQDRWSFVRNSGIDKKARAPGRYLRNQA